MRHKYKLNYIVNIANFDSVAKNNARFIFSRTSTSFFGKKSFNYSCKKARSYMLDWVVKTPLNAKYQIIVSRLFSCKPYYTRAF